MRNIQRGCLLRRIKGRRGRKNNFIEKDKPVAYTTAIESEINFIMYELYGLTQEEIEIVEGS
jgi:hypothetical protein